MKRVLNTEKKERFDYTNQKRDYIYIYGMNINGKQIIAGKY